uniref:Uncharacterized protein n=1 Tax=Coccolithus braarudii TaxID=221442 RepID=A0A7S0LBL0_9EUKA|mmetsp:Transcript_31592/g.67933  ORF Transcript_31592/g.67933 Transcript_31592/m.67933 type:complete len:108 (+) Transcript_31592:155-478(+)|eukprot:CAMPEP_0183332702 /NCGR_PEP_ID=MMETSP0164_2-20130417/1800_1 /TAXON_ID=221442 /ORGANISM="Coccolithus pelagicus ssp braarudi, Strain PLY182g" /LENGTH=107 /DNA_ID=CAMNT_0025501477 /DNA_START=111 /DNA_END=434 /DNA_ORIENTATION=+
MGFGRTTKGGNSKAGKHKTKQQVRRERTAKAPAGATPRTTSTTADEQLKAKRAAGAAKMKAWRDRTGGVAQRPKPVAKKPSKEQLRRQREAIAIAAIPKGQTAIRDG